MGYSGIDEQAYYAQNYMHGDYQFCSIDDIINQFMVVYTGEDKILGKTSRTDIAFFAQRNLAELSFDTFKSVKALELQVPSSLSIVMPRDYVNYVKVSWIDSSGIKRNLYNTKDTSAPSSPLVDSDGDFIFNESGDFSFGGEILYNGNFNGGNLYWQNDITTTVLFDGNGDQTQGWNITNNKLVGVAIPTSGNISQKLQNNIEIKNAEQYKLTFTVSGYTSGAVQFLLIDELGHSSVTASFNADGTYTETITAGATTEEIGTYTANTLIINNGGVANFNGTIDNISLVKVGAEDESTALSTFQSTTSSEISNQSDDYEDDTYWPAEGERYGLDPSRAQINGSFYIDEIRGRINFGSNISGKTVILEYISDSLGTDDEMKVHKLAEDAMYKSILCDALSTKMNIGRGQLAMYKKDKFAAVRKAKLRLSNIKLEDLTRILRGKSKQIKH